MKNKTINSVITKKFNEWVATIEDRGVQNLVKQHTVITGGCIASMINNEEVKDFDVYFTNRATVVAVAKYYINKFHEAKPPGPEIRVFTSWDFRDKQSDLHREYQAAVGAEEQDRSFIDFVEGQVTGNDPDDDRVILFIRNKGIASEKEVDLDDSENPLDDYADDVSTASERPKYRPVFFSSNAITLSDKIQIVTRFCGSPAKIHDNFDFLHATNYWTSEEKKVVMDVDAYAAVHNKELIYVGSKYPLCSLFRMRKFIKRGFTITAGEVLKIAMNVNEFDLTNAKVLRDQLVGVDSAYFNQLIGALKKHEKVDRAYITAIINKMYN